MPLTVIQIVQKALYSLNSTPPSTLYSPTTPQQLHLTSILDDQSRALRNHWTWPQLKRIDVFTLVSGQDKYMLPPDYYSALPDTQWDDTYRMRLIGPMSDADFTTTTRGVNALSRVGFRIFGPDANPNSAGGQFVVTPTPGTSGKELSFEYLSKNLYLPPNWTPSEAGITTNEYRNANGNNYRCTAITTGTTGTTAPSHTSGSAVDGGVTWFCDSAVNAYEVPRSDNDLSLFDDDVMIAGVKWRYLKAKDLDWEVEYESYKAALDSAKNRFKGTFVGSFCRTRQSRRYTVPNGSWSL